MRVITTPDAVAAYSLVTSVSPTVNATSVYHLVPNETTSPSKATLVSGRELSSVGAALTSSLSGS
jgi:hypothetical protein